ncbi:MAG: ATP-grasp domain-containing protein [candidate division Zixibacteria bacterium]|nr:ATP-grasp domain-containing protein [candidate division Zixibacteria bacterium]
MKVAIVYNRSSEKVINLFGRPNRETIGLKTIKRISDGLKKGGHQVKAIEGDKDIIDKLEDFMPRVVKGEVPGMVFNLSYGIQGQARYTHIPGILEMVGIPYVGSGPLAHSLALDKVVAKMIFRQNGLPTPDFAVLDSPGFQSPEMEYPLIVKPKTEAVSFGLKIVNNEDELREAAGVIFDAFQQPVLVEQYIEGREINVGLIGNNPPETLPPVELVFTPGGPKVYTYEDKTQRSGRSIEFNCPANLDKKLMETAKEIALRAFQSLGCCDCARVDMRLDDAGNLYILEINSLPSLGEHGSYTIAAQKAGLDFSKLVNRLVEVASARYFGTPSPPKIITEKKDSGAGVFSYLVERRDLIEKRIREWTNLSSRTGDPTGVHEGTKRLERLMEELAMKPHRDFTDAPNVWTWRTGAGITDGILLVGHLDIPITSGTPFQGFRRDPEWLYGEGIGVSRAPLAMIEFALRSLRSMRKLRKIPLGVMYYADEGIDCRYSREIVTEAASRAKNVIILRPANMGNKAITQRRGLRKYRLTAEDAPRRLGKASRKMEVFRWVCGKLDSFARLSSRKDRIAIAVAGIETDAYPQLLPHRIKANILVSYADSRQADSIDKQMRDIVNGERYGVNLELTSERPPMPKRRANERLLKSFNRFAEIWDIPFAHESSLYPSAAGLVPSKSGVICGMGPVAKDIDTPNECVQRISVLQRTLLLSQFLLEQTGK